MAKQGDRVNGAHLGENVGQGVYVLADMALFDQDRVNGRAQLRIQGRRRVIGGGAGNLDGCRRILACHDSKEVKRRLLKSCNRDDARG